MPANAEQLKSCQPPPTPNTPTPSNESKEALRRLDRTGQPSPSPRSPRPRPCIAAGFTASRKCAATSNGCGRANTVAPTARCPPLNGPAPNPCGNESKRSAKKPHGSASTTRPYATTPPESSAPNDKPPPIGHSALDLQSPPTLLGDMSTTRKPLRHEDRSNPATDNGTSGRARGCLHCRRYVSWITVPEPAFWARVPPRST